MEINKIYNLDCLKLFKKMKDKNVLVDAIITDPPYSLDFVNKKNFSPFVLEKWDNDFNQLNWIKESASLVKEGGSMIIFNHWRNLSEINQELEKNNFLVKDLIRWVKPNPLWKNITEEYTTDYELAIWAVKGREWTFNFERQLINNLKNKKNPYLVPEYIGGSVIGEERIHPTQKNLQVIKDIIALHTNPNDLILDPFMGSATTAVACLELGRNFIGSEIDKEYFRKTETRLKKLNFQETKKDCLETEHELSEDDLKNLIKEAEIYIEELEKEMIASKEGISSDNEYGQIGKRLLAKEKAKKELEKIVCQWKIRLSEIISKNQEEMITYVEEGRKK